MKAGDICLQATADLRFSADDLRVLWTCSQHHYDGHCKEQSSPGGIITTWQRIHKNGFRSGERVTTSIVDTLLKILEGLHSEEGRMSPRLLRAGYRLRGDLRVIIRELSGRSATVTKWDAKATLSNHRGHRCECGRRKTKSALQCARCGRATLAYQNVAAT